MWVALLSWKGVMAYCVLHRSCLCVAVSTSEFAIIERVVAIDVVD